VAVQGKAHKIIRLVIGHSRLEKIRSQAPCDVAFIPPMSSLPLGHQSFGWPMTDLMIVRGLPLKGYCPNL